jgi:predicted DNA-binding WGR domain protein
LDDHVYLEYSKGSSSKFWEATLVGRVVTFHWGKIGTKGQTHKKRFKTPEAAIAEFSKKARAKVRKGYVEIIPEEEESATPEPAREAASEPDEPESAVASVASTVTKSAVVEQSSPDTPVEPSPEDKKSSARVDKPEVAWTEELLKLAGPLRDNLHTPIPERTAEQALEMRSTGRSRIVKYKGKGPKALSKGIVGAREWFDGIHDELTREQAAAAHVFANGKESASALSFDIATYGVEEALERYIDSLQYSFDNTDAYDAGGYLTSSNTLITTPDKVRATRTANATGDIFHWTHRLHGLVVARQALATVPLETYEKARAASDAIYKKQQFLPTRCFITALFPDEDRFDELVKDPLLEDWTYGSCWTILALGTRDFEKVAKCLARDRFKAHLADPVFWSLLYQFGGAASELFASLVGGNIEEPEEQASLIRTPDGVAYWARRVNLDVKAFDAAIKALSECPVESIVGASARAETAARLFAARLVMDFPDTLEKARQDPRANKAALDALATAKKVVSDDKLPDVLRDPPWAGNKKKTPRLPSWAVPAALPPVRFIEDEEVVLSRDAVVTLLQLMANIDTSDPDVGFSQMRECFTAKSLEDFALDLFEIWLELDASSKGAWALHALGEFGGDESVRRLTPKIRRWPGESAAKRAQWGLDVLARVGTDFALMNIYSIAHKMRYKSLKKHAETLVEELAASLDLTEEQLGDRLVPDFDLDARGRLQLDYGPRQFEISLDEHLQPLVHDDSGKKLKNLPKPGSKDDAELAKEAYSTFKGFKKDLKEVAKQQLRRIEDALVSGRRWSAEAFISFLVEHPLMINLTHRLLWGSFKEGELVKTFRVDIDHSTRDIDDEPIDISNTSIGLVHPCMLDASEVLAWSDVFGEYEIIQPFAQLTREVIDKEDALRMLEEQILGATFPAGKLVFGLEKRGWKRGPAIDNGIFTFHTSELTDRQPVVICYEGYVTMRDIEPEEPLTITAFLLEVPSDYGAPRTPQELPDDFASMSQHELSEFALGLRFLLDA